METSKAGITCERCGKPKPINIYRVCDRCLEDKHEERRAALLRTEATCSRKEQPMTEPKLPSAPSPAGETASEGHRHTHDCILGCKYIAYQGSFDSEYADDPVATEPVSTEGDRSHSFRGLRCVWCCAPIDTKNPICDGRPATPDKEPAAPIAPAAVSEADVPECEHMVATNFCVLCGRGPLAPTIAKSKPSAEGDGWIAELRYGLKLVEHALADENVEHVAPWTRMRNWLNQRDIYNGDLQDHRVTLEVVKKLLTLLPAPPSGQGEVR